MIARGDLPAKRHGGRWWIARVDLDAATEPSSPPLTAYTMRYLSGIPRKPLPPGQVVVHNRVAPTRRLGSRGFRAWIAATEPDPPELARLHQVIRCGCGWAPELPEHYRSVVERADEGDAPARS